MIAVIFISIGVSWGVTANIAVLGQPVIQDSDSVVDQSLSLETYDNKENFTTDTNYSQLMVLESINKSNSEMLKKIDELTNSSGKEVMDIVSSYLTAISFLIGVATFLLGFFMGLEHDGKLSDRMKLNYRVLTLGLVIPSIYMVGHSIYLITTELGNITYLITLILTSIPIGILIYLIRKR